MPLSEGKTMYYITHMGSHELTQTDHAHIILVCTILSTPRALDTITVTKLRLITTAEHIGQCYWSIVGSWWVEGVVVSCTGTVEAKLSADDGALLCAEVIITYRTPNPAFQYFHSTIQ